MIESVIRSADGKTFALSINGEQHTYSNDKEGKRQAILDGLNAIETVTVGQDVYLPSNEALQVVAAVLYPDGIQTEAAYQTVCDVTEKACAHLGYGAEVELGPPAVPFSRRGSFRKQHPPVDVQIVLEELELAGTGSTFPRQEVACTILWNKAGLAVYGRHWSKLTTAEQRLVQTQVDEIAGQAGWRKDDSTATGTYTKPLPIDEAAARSRLVQLIRQENGRPVLVSSVIYQAQLGAYGRGFYSNELAPVLQAIVTETLQAQGMNARVVDAYSVKPIDAETLRSCGRSSGKLLVVEDHWYEGGLGDAVAAAIEIPVAVHRLAISQEPRSGAKSELLDRYGISRRAIVDMALSLRR